MSKYYSYNGNIITASSKEEAIYKIISKRIGNKIPFDSVENKKEIPGHNKFWLSGDLKVYEEVEDKGDKFLYLLAPYTPNNRNKDRHRPSYLIQNSKLSLDKIVEQTWPELLLVKGKEIAPFHNLTMTVDGVIHIKGDSTDSKAVNCRDITKYNKNNRNRVNVGGHQVSPLAVYKRLFPDGHALDAIKLELSKKFKAK